MCHKVVNPALPKGRYEVLTLKRQYIACIMDQDQIDLMGGESDYGSKCWILCLIRSEVHLN